MRAEAAHWLQSAGADREAAALLLRARRFSHAAFMAHQAAEKALKAAVIAATRDYPPLTHNLRVLAERTGAPQPEGLTTALLRLGPHYTASRYPDAAGGPPELAYNAAIARELLAASDVAREWAVAICKAPEPPEGGQR